MLLGHSGLMSSRTEDATPARSALICVETPVDQAGHPIALPRLFGKPLVFHQIKQLERLGIVDFVVAVDSVPAELPEIAELFSKGPTSVRIVRQGAELSHEQMFESEFLLIAPDIWIDDDMAAQAAKWRGNSIGIVAEDPSTAKFERIDLNRRWSGLAVLDAHVIAHCAKMPDGWSLASFLLRHSLQSGAQEVQIDQSIIMQAKLRKIAENDDLPQIAQRLARMDDEIGYAERFLAKSIVPIMPIVTNVAWLATAIMWAPLSIAAASAATAYFGYYGIALALLIAALASAVVRSKIRNLEYRRDVRDGPSITSYLIMISVIWFVLHGSGADRFDATFLTLLTFALLLMGRLASDAFVQQMVSPFNFGIALLLLWLTFPILAGFKILVLGLYGLLLFGAFRGKRKQAELNSN